MGRQKVARIGPWKLCGGQSMFKLLLAAADGSGGGAAQMMDSGCNQIGFVQRSPDE